MSQTARDKIKALKRFYVHTYRTACHLLIFSVVCNVSLAGVLYYIYFSQSERNYYATDGIKPPLALIAMDRPNYSSQPILSTDPVDDDNAQEKVMVP